MNCNKPPLHIQELILQVHQQHSVSSSYEYVITFIISPTTLIFVDQVTPNIRKGWIMLVKNRRPITKLLIYKNV